MAEFVFKEELEKRKIAGIAVSSRGLAVTDGCMNPLAVQTLKSHGVKHAGFVPKQMDERTYSRAWLIVCMTKSHKNAFMPCDKVKTLGELVASDDVPDPYGGDADVYEACFCKLKKDLSVLADVLFPTD